MVDLTKFLTFQAVWVIGQYLICPHLAINIITIFAIFVGILPFQIQISNFYLLCWGFIISLFQIAAFRVLINANLFFTKWIYATAVGTYLGKLVTEGFGWWAIPKFYGIDDGNFYNDFYESFFAYPILSFLQGIVFSTDAKFNVWSGLIWWALNSIWSISLGIFGYITVQNPNIAYKSFLFPSLEYVTFSGIIIALIFNLTYLNKESIQVISKKSDNDKN